jgi:endopeptidase Clp ATP-binding regulatory subunit ClpX
MYFDFDKANDDRDDGDDSSNPFDDLKRQFSEIFSASGAKMGFVLPGAMSGAAEQQSDDSEAEKKTGEFVERIKKFDMKPREIRDFLDRFVIKQSEAKKVLSVAICDHYNHVRKCLSSEEAQLAEYNKQNVLILGPTGVGKTYLIRNIAKLVGVPFVKVDATKFSETGYAGSDVDEMIRDLVKAADGNAEIAQYGIVFIDEIDKIAIVPDSSNRDVSGRGVQINLLKLMEDSDVSAYGQSDMLSQLRAAMSFANGGGRESKQHINTKHVLFIASGAFDKLSDIVKTRMGAKSIGFSSQSNTRERDEAYEYLKQVSTADFMQYGFEPEFIGRLPVRVACEALNADDLKSILASSEGSILKQYADDFAGYGITFEADDEALMVIAKLAEHEKTGARGLLTILEKTLRNFKFELPSMNIRQVKVTKSTVENPIVALRELIAANEEGASQVKPKISGNSAKSKGNGGSAKTGRKAKKSGDDA